MAKTEHINPMLKSLAVPLAKLQADPTNARKHSEKNIQAIMNSLSSYGQQKPLIVKAGVVLAGNGTLEAAKRLGWESLAALEFDKDRHLVSGYKLADNRSAELAEWDFESLAEQLKALEADMDVTDLGWDENEIKNILAADWTPPEPTNDDGTPLEMESIKLTKDQFEVVKKAISKIRGVVDDPEMSDGRALELICADYIA